MRVQGRQWTAVQWWGRTQALEHLAQDDQLELLAFKHRVAWTGGGTPPALLMRHLAALPFVDEDGRRLQQLRTRPEEAVMLEVLQDCVHRVLHLPIPILQQSVQQQVGRELYG